MLLDWLYVKALNLCFQQAAIHGIVAAPVPSATILLARSSALSALPSLSPPLRINVLACLCQLDIFYTFSHLSNNAHNKFCFQPSHSLITKCIIILFLSLISCVT